MPHGFLMVKPEQLVKIEFVKTYLLVLGSFPELSRAELRGRCDEVFYDAEKNLLLAENLQFTNPREIPRAKEQMFIDQLGGTVRLAEVVGEYFDRAKLEQAIWQRIEAAEKFKCGFTVFGGGKKLLGDLIHRTKDHFQKIRLENYKGENLSSGQIFQRRILQKGHEFIVWQRGNSYLLCETVANQNLRNYELRDRGKDFRDAKMGMLPPKLAQILLNLAVQGVRTSTNAENTKSPDSGVTVLDPFCGSGTVNIEAAIAGFPTAGSDLNERFVTKASENFAQMAEKFRYDPSSGNFFQADAAQCLFTPSSQPLTPNLVVATEGYLGQNFEARPDRATINKNAGEVAALWRSVLDHLAKNKVLRIALCLPAWNRAGSKQSISEKIIAHAQKLGYQPELFPSGKPTSFYERDKAFVAREVLILFR